jgi:hypothetical protein
MLGETMNDPYEEFHVAHPLYLKGVAQERQRIHQELTRVFGGYHNPATEANPSLDELREFKGFVHAMIIALDVVTDEYDED